MRIRIIITLLLLTIISGCQPKKINTAAATFAISESTNTPQITQTTARGKPRALPVMESNAKEVVFHPDSIQFRQKQEAPVAHKKYLNEALEYMTLPAYNWKATAVAGNTTTLFYPGAVVAKTGDEKNLPKGVVIPFGTVLPILGEITNSDTQYNNLFLFEEEYNYFYKTEWQGKQGLVFGADLEGINNTNSHNTITSLLYQNKAIFDTFPPFNGYRMLQEDEKAQLEKNRLAFQQVSKNEYRLSEFDPDDMLALYKKEKDDQWNPIFITTDLIAHGLHLFFNNYLQSIEENFMVPRLLSLVDNYLEKIQLLNVPAGDSKYSQTVQSAKTYFEIAQALLRMTANVVEKRSKYDEFEGYDYIEVDKTKILADYAPNVVEELNLILEAAGYKLSPNFGYKEDFSQYKPRGHYTKNTILSAYFRTMMWFGRLHIYMTVGDEITKEKMNDPSLDLSIKLLPIAGLITQMSIDNPDLYKKWQQLFDPITELIGMSDDLSLDDVVPFWKSLGIKDFAAWVEKKENVVDVINAANKKLRSPLIAGNSVVRVPAGPKQTPPMGWRLFGQRFTYDSYVHQLVSDPRLDYRNFVWGLDIMKAFGSQTAEQLLAETEYKHVDTEQDFSGARLKSLLDDLTLKFEQSSPAIWTVTYYNRVLNMIRTQAIFEPGAGFYFTESPLWGVKALNAAHGTWAELRHDTILYVKQVYAERAGDGDYTPTFRTLPVPKPVHYIEPNIPFFGAALAAVGHLSQIAYDYELFYNHLFTRIGTWRTLLEKALAIVNLEYKDNEVPAADVQWIKTIPNLMVDLVLPPESDSSIWLEEDDLKSAIIADVYTNALFGVALEVGTGIPQRMYVALNDHQGGKRIAVGYTYSYYEFYHPMNDRLTNEQWRKQVYDPQADLTEMLPFWARGIALPPRK